MTSPVSRFLVEGLFERKDVELQLDEGQLVLVGENGSGKSSVVTLLYLSLTAQWARMSEVSFTAVSLTIGGKVLRATKAAILRALQMPERTGGPLGFIRRRVGPQRAAVLVDLLRQKPIDHWMTHRPDLEKLGARYGVPASVLMDLLIEGDSSEPSSEDQFRADEWEATVKEHLHAQVLFLPTYRRIERDLKAIFPSLNIEPSLREFQDRQDHTRSARGFIELVEFGMTDVDRVRSRTTSALDRSFRGELSRLAGEYLRDIIRNEYTGGTAVDFSDAHVAEDLADILSRIPDEVLSASDRDALRALMASGAAKPPNKRRSSRDAILAHYVSKLLALHSKQKQQEAPIRQFVAVCNEYLNGKRVVFDAKAFSLTMLEHTEGGEDPLRKPREIPLSGLSSGEKQIVSLFAHVILSGEGPYFVIIDEPELSISVDWQKRFLTDLTSTGLCVGLVAVTHSPFVFQNELKPKAHAMSEFVRPATPR